jgi:hypothetical protein
MKKFMSQFSAITCILFIVALLTAPFLFSPQMARAAGVPIAGNYLTNGQVLVGSTGAAPVAATLTGTAGQITVTNGAGTITLATPQSIATTSAPTFKDLTVTYGVVARTVSATSATMSTLNISGSGQILLGNATSAALGALAPGQARRSDTQLRHREPVHVHRHRGRLVGYRLDPQRRLLLTSGIRK